MPSTQTGSPPAHDAAAAPEYLPFSMLESAARAAIRAIPHSRLRDTAYARFSAALAEAQAMSPRKMPWEDPQQVTSITRDGAIQALKALDQAVKSPGTITQPEYHRYAHALEKALDRNSSPDMAKRGKYARQCARPGCGVTFTTDQPRARFHSGSCRQLAYRQAKRAKTALREQSPEVHSPAVPLWLQYSPQAGKCQVKAPVQRMRRMPKGQAQWSRLMAPQPLGDSTPVP